MGKHNFMQITLNIPNMKSHHCQMTVSNAVNAAEGTIVSIEPTKAVIEFDDHSSKEKIIAAVETAGYRVANR